MTFAAEIRRARTAFWWVGVIAPAALLVVASAIVAAWYAELPDPVAVHWGTDGANGFAPRWTIFLTPLIGAALVALFAGIALVAHRLENLSSSNSTGGIIRDADGAPRWSTTARLLGAVTLGEAGLMALVTVVGADAQRGVEDAAQAADITGWVFIGFAVLAALAAAGWFLQPRVVSAAPVAEDAEPVAFAPTEQAAWFGTASVARGGAITLVALWLVTVALAVFVLVQGEVLAGLVIVAAVVISLVAIASSMMFRVRVSGAGLQVRSLLGWPNTRLRLDDIDRVEVVTINPFAEFGGWGWRLGMDGRRGVVLRAGEALQVTQRNGRVFVVTIDGADEAAAVLAGLRAAAE